MGLSIVDQAFIQSMMAAKAANVARTLELYNAAIEGVKGARGIKLEDGDALEMKIDKINKELNHLEFQFRTVYSPWEKDTFWGLCNVIEDEAVHTGTFFKESARTLFFAISEELRDLDGEMLLTDAHNFGKEAGLKVNEASQEIQRFHRGQWLRIVKQEDQATILIFGPRALLELPKIRTWLMQRNFEAGAAPTPKGETKEKEDVEMGTAEIQEESDDEIKMTRKRRSGRQNRQEMAVAEPSPSLSPSPVRARRRQNPRRSVR